VLDKAEYSAFESTLKIVSYVSFRNYSNTQPLFSVSVTLVQRHVSTKLDVSTACLLPENRRYGTDGRTDGCSA